MIYSISCIQITTTVFYHTTFKLRVKRSMQYCVQYVKNVMLTLYFVCAEGRFESPESLTRHAHTFSDSVLRLRVGTFSREKTIWNCPVNRVVNHFFKPFTLEILIDFPNFILFEVFLCNFLCLIPNNLQTGRLYCNDPLFFFN